jgi:hypothetical protein
VLYAQQQKMLPMLGGMGGPPGIIQAAQVLPGPGPGGVMLQPGMPSRQPAALVAQPQVVVPGQVLAPSGAVQPLQLQPVQPQVLLVPPPAQHQFQGALRHAGGGGGGPGVMAPLMQHMAPAGARHAGGMPLAYAPGGPPGQGGGGMPPEGPALFFDPSTGMYYQQQFQQ